MSYYTNTDDPSHLLALKELRMTTKRFTIQTILDCEEINSFIEASMVYEPRCEGHYTVWYLKNVSLMLSIVPGVHEAVLECDLQAEGQILNLIFALDHQNYARYCSYQHLYLTNMTTKNSLADGKISTIADLVKYLWRQVFIRCTVIWSNNTIFLFTLFF